MTAGNSTQGALLIADANLTICYVNTATCDRLGLPVDWFMGRSLDTLTVEPPVPPLRDQIAGAVDQHADWSGRITFRNGDGAILEATVSIMPIWDPGGRLLAHSITVHDPSADAQRDGQKRHVQKTETLAGLAAELAHGFNNLLTGIIGYTNVALGELPAHSTARPDLEKVLRAGQRAQALADQVLAFCREQTPPLEPVRLDEVLDEALRLLSVLLPKSIIVKKDSRSDGAWVTGDAPSLLQVILNLCSNARDAMSQDGGLLELRLESMMLDASAVPMTPPLAAGRYWRLSVCDTGCGMDPAILEHVFEPYFTTKALGVGTGLGLATCLEVVHRHGGAITVESAAGQGTVFHVYLRQLAWADPASARTLEPLPQGKGERVLLVDDAAFLVRMHRQVLERLGYQVTARHSPHDAIEAFRFKPDAFDLVIAEQGMAHVTGLDMALELRQLRPGVPIILTNGSRELLTPERLQAARIDAALIKPVRIKDLAIAVSEVLGASRS